MAKLPVLVLEKGAFEIVVVVVVVVVVVAAAAWVVKATVDAGADPY